MNSGIIWDLASNSCYEIPPKKNEFSIGKSENDLTLDDAGVSGSHCLIERTDEGWKLKDLESTNGTYLNNNQISSGGVQALNSFELISLGDQHLLFFDHKISLIKDRNQLMEAIASNLKDEELLAHIKTKAIAFMKNIAPRYIINFKLAKVEQKIKKGQKLKMDKTSGINIEIDNINEEMNAEIAAVQKEIEKIKSTFAKKVEVFEEKRNVILSQLNPQLQELADQKSSLEQELDSLEKGTNPKTNAG